MKQFDNALKLRIKNVQNSTMRQYDYAFNLKMQNIKCYNC